MNLTLVALGTRGDVEPVVALGVGLKAAGHRVRLATAESFAPLAAAAGLEFHAIDGDLEGWMRGPDGVALIAAGMDPDAFADGFVDSLEIMAEPLLDATLQACEGADAIVCAMLVSPARHVAERLGAPFVAARFAPWGRLTELGGGPEPPLGFRARDLVARWRRRLGLPPEGEAEPAGPVLRAYSAAVVPGPAESVTGYWFLDRPWAPPPALLDFLAAGPPPVCIGFGSMPSRDPAALAELAMQALARAGRRGVLLTGWGGLGDAALSGEVLALEAAPHDWLLPRAAALVHHGGAGTTAAAARAGAPQVIVPFIADQLFWGRRVHALGVGPAPIPRTELTAERLATAIRAATDGPQVRSRAAVLA
ncbi:MAG TPA: glycosyltransferase, partial [Solirubrobacterales bacterium]